MECCCSYVDLYGLKTTQEIMLVIKTVSEVPLGELLTEKGIVCLIISLLYPTWQCGETSATSGIIRE